MFEGVDTAEAQRERARVVAGELPTRYAEPWGRCFFAAAEPALRSDVRILDVGGGRAPILPPEGRPPGTTYVGLDISEQELTAAPAGSYDEIVVADIGKLRPELIGRFDLVLSWQTLEHVVSVALALDNIHRYLCPGGRLVAQLSGSYAAFALLARLVPYRVANVLMRRLMDAAEHEKFPTRYDRCTARGLEPLLAQWREHEIVPRYRGGAYVRFLRPLEQVYLRYENWAEHSGRANLATHYLVWAVR